MGGAPRFTGTQAPNPLPTCSSSDQLPVTNGLSGAEPVGTVESSVESSEEEGGGDEMRPRVAAQGQQSRVQSTVVRTLTSPLPGPNTIAHETHAHAQGPHKSHGTHGTHGSHAVHGMVRNSTEPGSTPRMAVSMAVTSQSTWI